MSLRSDVIQKWWPATQCLDLVEGAVEDVAKAVHQELCRFVQGEAVAATWEACPNLDSAFCMASEFANVPTVYLVLPTRSKWSVLWNNNSLCDGYDSLCWCLSAHHGLTTIHWSASDGWTSFQSGATFTHRRRPAGKVVERVVHAGQTDDHWDFCAVGEPLPEEDVAGYAARRKRDRLNEERVSALLSRLGAKPWQEEFYALPQSRVFVMRRENAPRTIVRRSRAEVLRMGQQDGAANGSRPFRLETKRTSSAAGSRR
jgi:hypothetical protein